MARVRYNRGAEGCGFGSGQGNQRMKTTMQKIADEAGVSRGTVDRALHHRGRIDPEVESRIFRIAGAMGYSVDRPGRRGKKAAAKKAIRLGVITYLCRAGFMQEINRGIDRAREELREWNVEVLLRESATLDEARQLAFIDELLAEGIDGLAIMPIDTGAVTQRLYDIEKNLRLPLVMFNSALAGIPRLCYVGMDNFKSGRTAAGLMNALTQGEGKILVITGTFSNQLNNARVDGFAQELKESFPGLSIAAVQSSFDSGEEVRRIVEDALANIAGINGIFVVSSGQSGLREALGALGPRKRPRVIIYDQTPKNELLLKDDLVDFMIDQSGYEQGYRPLYILANAISGKSVPESDSEYTDISIRTKYNLSC